MKTVTLITCDSTIEANLIQGRLKNEGIESFLTNENFSNLMPHYSNILGSGVQIMVWEADYAPARELIRDKLEPQIQELVCPICGSHEIGLGVGRHKGTKFFQMLASILFLIPMGNLKPKYYCKKCRTEIK